VSIEVTPRNSHRCSNTLAAFDKPATLFSSSTFFLLFSDSLVFVRSNVGRVLAFSPDSAFRSFLSVFHFDGSTLLVSWLAEFELRARTHFASFALAMSLAMNCARADCFDFPIYFSYLSFDLLRRISSSLIFQFSRKFQYVVWTIDEFFLFLVFWTDKFLKILRHS
jgi:hypothetical protein